MGSGIIFNNGGGGGASVNPTNTYMPVNIGGSFVDSIIQCIPNTFAQSMRGASGFGFGTSVSGTSCQSWLGDWNNQIDNVYIEVKNDAISSRIFTANRGFYLDYVINRYIFGDWANIYNGVNLNIDDTNRQVCFTDNNIIDGLFLNYFSNYYQLGQITTNNVFTIDALNQQATINLAGIGFLTLDRTNQLYQFGNYTGGTTLSLDEINQFGYIQIGTVNYIEIDKANQYFNIGETSSRAWIELNWSNGTTKLGDITGAGNITQINIDDLNNEIQFRANAGGNIILDYNGLKLNGPTQPTASGPADHLQVNVNGTNYVIQLLNP